MRHEATVAEDQGKLIAVLLEPLKAHQFPMGLYSRQAVNLADWNGDFNHEEWRKLARDVEARLMPAWAQQKFFEAGSGDYFMSRYKSVMKNLKIADSKFKADWPKGTKVEKPR